MVGKKSQLFHSTIKIPVYMAIKKHCKDNKISISRFIRTLILEYMDRNGIEPESESKGPKGPRKPRTKYKPEIIDESNNSLELEAKLRSILRKRGPTPLSESDPLYRFRKK